MSLNVEGSCSFLASSDDNISNMDRYPGLHSLHVHYNSDPDEDEKKKQNPPFASADVRRPLLNYKG